MNTPLIEIVNNGTELVSTNYWDSEHAARGLCYLSANAGVLRLLVPEVSTKLIEEMKTGQSVTIEPSISVRGAVDIVFNDGTDAPFSLTIDRRQSDRPITAGRCKFSVWTAHGKCLELNCELF